MESLSIKAVLNHSSNISSIEWNPGKLELCLTTQDMRLYFWTDDGAYIMGLPYSAKDFKAVNISWNKQGDGIIIRDKV